MVAYLILPKHGREERAGRRRGWLHGDCDAFRSQGHVISAQTTSSNAAEVNTYTGHGPSTSSRVAVSGFLYRKPSAGYSAFAAVNGAIEALVKVLAIELAPIRINALVPGQIDTLRELIGEQANRGRVEAAAAKLPVGRIGTPEDVAHAALFLAENRFTTGTVLDVDGGER